MITLIKLGLLLNRLASYLLVAYARANSVPEGKYFLYDINTGLVAQAVYV